LAVARRREQFGPPVTALRRNEANQFLAGLWIPTTTRHATARPPCTVTSSPASSKPNRWVNRRLRSFQLFGAATLRTPQVSPAARPLSGLTAPVGYIVDTISVTLGNTCSDASTLRVCTASTNSPRCCRRGLTGLRLASF